MKRLNGGEFLLDLTPIEIEESVDSETYTSITNEDVLNQLTNLKRYINNPSAIKPVWVKFNNSETDEIVVIKGELSKVIDDPEFDIHVKSKNYDLTIHIEFTQMLNEDEDPIDDWYIDTNDAKYICLSSNIAEVVQEVIADSVEDGTLPALVTNIVNAGIESGDIQAGGKLYAYKFQLRYGTPTGYTHVSGADGGGDSNEIITLFSTNPDLSINNYSDLCSYFTRHEVGTTTNRRMPIVREIEYGVTKLSKEIDGVTHYYLVTNRIILYNLPNYVQTCLIDLANGTQLSETTGTITLFKLGVYDLN